MTKRSRFLPGILFGFLAAIAIAAYYAYATFYNQILEESAMTRVNVEELDGTHPLQLRVTIQSFNSAQDIRTVTAKRQRKSVSVRYHLALAGLVKPQLGWHEPYLLTVPDSVNEFRFGRDSQVIWRSDTCEVFYESTTGPSLRVNHRLTGQNSVFGPPGVASMQRAGLCSDDCRLPDKGHPWPRFTSLSVLS